MSKKVKQLRRFKSLPSQILEQIYFKGILPSVTYGISVWENCSEAKLGSLEKIHLRCGQTHFQTMDTTLLEINQLSLQEEAALSDT